MEFRQFQSAAGSPYSLYFKFISVNINARAKGLCHGNGALVVPAGGITVEM